jgi:hypothetical protein
MPPSEGIPPSTPPLASNMFEVVSRKWLEPWPCTGTSSVIHDSVLLEGSRRTLVEGWLSIPRGLWWAWSPLFTHLETSVCRSPF